MSDSSSIEALANIRLRLVQDGVAVDQTQAIPASELWKEKLTLIFAARRPGCGFCREHASDLATHFVSGTFVLLDLIINTTNGRLDYAR
jgi:hypothetical protein